MGELTFNKILIPVDFSDNCKRSLKAAVGLGKIFKSKLYALHVISLEDLEAIQKASSLLIDSNVKELIKERIEYERYELKTFFPPEEAEGLDIEYVIETGRPHNTILDKIKNEEIDLVVICTHGKSNLPYVLFGSVADRVIRKSSCPVFVVRATEYKEARDPGCDS